MAILKLQNVTVTFMNNVGNGVKLTESKDNDGKTYKTKYTAWFKEHSGLSVGDVVSLSGFLGAKVGEPWTGDDGQERRSVELSINSPRIDTGKEQNNPSAVQHPANGASVAAPWATTPNAQPDDSELPF